ncbi:sensor histidine kinase [Algoriphagus boritolerans]|uniref:histidine kinase n=1 Tax=Algoriphagus boritolerans DSM 17298 = JCM 18970 TaxID=1120964 RepID=A0A1H5V5J3_9BACT|nr:ATP-binding protein [Algoriphagus boritolerans]SEF82645.1 Two component regulator propeller [Algoriphagus boritolerans DSM 17298 = JCM 18970]
MQKLFFRAAFFSLVLFSLIQLKGFSQINASQGIPTITNYSPRDYQGTGQIWSLAQDAKGFIFLGTNTGIVKFDGKNWELLISPLKGYNTSTRALHLSNSGVLYYGSLADFGYIGENDLGNTIQISLIHLIPEEITLNDIWSINEVDGKIYFQAREAIFIYTPEKENQDPKIEIWKPDSQFMYSWEIDGTFYAHQIELGIFKERNGKLELIPGSQFLGKDRVQVMLPYTKPDEFLVGAFSGGLYHFDGKKFQKFETKAEDFLNSRLYRGISLADNQFGLGGIGVGFIILDSEGNQITLLTSKSGLIDDSVYSLLLDRAGTLWVGTNTGLSKIEISSPLTRFKSENEEIGSILSINSLDEELYIGGSTGVHFLDKSDGKIKKLEGIPNSQIFSLVKDEDRLLISNIGLYSLKNGKTVLIPGTEKLQILKILLSEKHPGYVFLSGAYGIAVFKRIKVSTSSIQPYAYESIGFLNQIDRYIYTLEEDDKGNLWAGTQAGDNYRITWAKTASGNIDLGGSTVRKFSEEDGIPGMVGRISKIQSRIFSSGINGFYYFDEDKDSFVRDTVFSFSDEVANINIDAFAVQGDDLDRALIVFKNEKKLAIPSKDGGYALQDYPINLFPGLNISAFFSEPNGVIWLGTDEGLIRIDDKKSIDTDIPFPVYFRQIISKADTLNHKNQEKDQALHKMKFKNNSIRFSYAAPFFIQEKLTKYQTFLDGYDEEWGKWEENSTREFNNLPHGTYTFRVKAQNGFHAISDEITYKFIILPPWYATWWAYLLYFFSFGLVIFGLVKFQSGRLVAIEKERARQKELEHAHEIEEAYQNLKATQDQLLQQEKLASLGQLTAGIAHEIKNPLNFVNNFADVSMELIDDMREELENDHKKEALALSEDIKSNLLKIHLHGTRADNIVKSMLLHSRGGSGKKEPTDLNAMVQEFSNLAFHGMRATKNPIPVSIELDLDDRIGKIPLYTDDFSRVILNLCNNAFDAMREKLNMEETYGKKYSPELIITSKSTTAGVELIFEDNGTGIPEEIQDKILQPFFTTKKGTEGTGLGLSITHDIIKRHNGNLSINSQLQKGTKFIIFLPNQI